MHDVSGITHNDESVIPRNDFRECNQHMADVSEKGTKVITDLCVQNETEGLKKGRVNYFHMFPVTVCILEICVIYFLVS